MIFKSYEWNNYKRKYKMVILSTKDVEKENINNLIGAGYEILVLPIKYKDIHNIYLDNARYLALCKKGQIIYV